METLETVCADSRLAVSRALCLFIGLLLYVFVFFHRGVICTAVVLAVYAEEYRTGTARQHGGCCGAKICYVLLSWQQSAWVYLTF